MPYSKEKVRKLVKLERKYYSKYVLKFDIQTFRVLGVFYF